MEHSARAAPGGVHAAHNPIRNICGGCPWIATRYRQALGALVRCAPCCRPLRTTVRGSCTLGYLGFAFSSIYISSTGVEKSLHRSSTDHVFFAYASGRAWTGGALLGRFWGPRSNGTSLFPRAGIAPGPLCRPPSGCPASAGLRKLPRTGHLVII